MHLLKQWLRIFWIHVNSCASIKLVEVVFGKRQPGCLPQLSVTCRRRICPLPTAKLPSREPGSAGRRWEPWPTRRMSSGSGTRRLALCRAAIQTWCPGYGIWRWAGASELVAPRVNVSLRPSAVSAETDRPRAERREKRRCCWSWRSLPSKDALMS